MRVFSKEFLKINSIISDGVLCSKFRKCFFRIALFMLPKLLFVGLISDSTYNFRESVYNSFCVPQLASPSFA